MSTTVEQIKSRLSIVDVVSSYIKLQKAGINYKAVCPFHNEKTPSFSVSLERGTFHCFGCGKGGDMFTFVEEMEGLDFMGTLRVLAERAGVEIVWDGKKDNKDEKERLYGALSEAAGFFHGELVKNTPALLYLKNRGLAAKMAEDFYLGFAPDSWDALYKYLLQKKYSGEEMEKAGLVLRPREGRKGWYDRFRSRIMFPISDSAGRIVGFSGRIFEKEMQTPSSAKVSAGEAKYVNSPETLLYNKSKILYGLDKAKRGIREQGFALLVEGQMDILLSHQIGLANTVAVSGTALTEEHLSLLKRFSEKIVFGFDGDAAGLAATRRAAVLGLRLGMDVFAAEIPEGKDPADFARDHPEAWKKSVSAAEPVISFLLKILAKQFRDSREFRIKVRQEVLPLVVAVKSAVEKAHFIELVAKKIGLPEESIREDMQELEKAQDGSFPGQGKSKESPMRPAKSIKESKSRSYLVERELAGVILWQNTKTEPDIKKDEVLSQYRAIMGAGRELFIDSLTDEEKQALVFSAEKMYSSAIERSSIAGELLLRLEEALLKEKRRKITDEISARETGLLAGGEESIRILRVEHFNISKRLQEIRELL